MIQAIRVARRQVSKELRSLNGLQVLIKVVLAGGRVQVVLVWHELLQNVSPRNTVGVQRHRQRGLCLGNTAIDISVLAMLIFWALNPVQCVSWVPYRHFLHRCKRVVFLSRPSSQR
jgi:hypothetical protein